MMNLMDELRPPTRLMLTPAPSRISPRVYRALATPIVGHVDPWFTELMGGVQMCCARLPDREQDDLSDFRFRSGGIEAAVVNALEPGDEAIVCVNGCFPSAWR